MVNGFDCSHMFASFPAVPLSSLPVLSVAQMREVDRQMEEEYGILLVQMMENAGRSLADLAQARLGGSITGIPVLVLAGKGNNGGGGLVAARHLANRGAEVQVVTARGAIARGAIASPSDAFGDFPAHQLQSLLSMGVSVTPAGDGWELPSADLVLDALIGYSLDGAPRGELADLIRLANSHPAAILALDVPSGLDADTGQAFTPCIRAAATLALALPKTGLLAGPRDIVRLHVGDLFLADISVPSALYAGLGIEAPPLFADGPILHLTPAV